jgi:hypothetical protein
MRFGTIVTRRRSRFLAAILAFAWLSLPSAVVAVECIAVDRYDLPRDCTALEELGHCLSNAHDVVEQCLEENTLSIWGWYRCHEDGAIDMAACYLISPWKIVMH